MAQTNTMTNRCVRCNRQLKDSKSIGILAMLDLKDTEDYRNGEYLTTSFTNNEYNPYAQLLQQKFNATGLTDKFGNRLKEDGIFGPKTQWVSDGIIGLVPSTGFINPLQPGISGVGYRTFTLKDGVTKKYQFYDMQTNQRLFEFDNHGLPNSKGKIIPDTPHLNVETPKGATNVQTQISKSINHKPIPKPVYETFKNFDEVAKTVKIAGKALAVAGVALDVYEIGSAVYTDLNDADKKLGKKTLQTTVGVGGSWAGGAKLGAMGGASIGTFFCPGLGTVIGGFIGGIAGGIAGAFAGRAIGEHIVDETYTGE